MLIYAGTFANEVLTTSLIKELLNKVKAEFPKNVRFEIEEQRTSSHYHLDFLGGINNVGNRFYSIIIYIFTNSFFENSSRYTKMFPM